MDETEAAALDRWVEAGGTLVATGETGLYDARGLPRTENVLKSLPIQSGAPLRPHMKGSYFRLHDGEHDWAPETGLMYLDGPYLTPHLADDAATEMTLIPPQRFGPPELCYPDIESDLPGVVRRKVGKGEAIQLPWLPDWLYHRDSLPDFRDLLVSLNAGRPPVKLRGKGRVELTASRKGRDGTMLVHVINYTGQSNNLYDEPVAIHGLRLGIATPVRRAHFLVAGGSIDVPVAEDSGYRWIDLPPVGAFEAIELEA
jgi:hypothetical protein